MSGTKGEEDLEEVKSPRSRSPAIGVSGLLRDHQKEAGSGGEEEGRRWSGPAGTGGGILRLDPAKPRRSSAASVEFKTDKSDRTSLQDDPSSPCPSDRLSVTWADGERSVSSDAVSLVPRGPMSPDQPFNSTIIPACGNLKEEPPEDEFDASVSAILKRSGSKSSRRSSKKRKKMRRTSTMTSGSGETVVEMEESVEDEVAETLRVHKEVLAGVKLQPWPISRKLRLARTAREYIRRHEGELEERLAQSTSTKDVLLRHFIRIRRVVRAGVRAVYLWVMGLEPWQGRIKTIESHFGSAVASYFTFLRWVLGLNVALTALLAAFVIIPEFLAADWSLSGERKTILEEDQISAFDFKVLWDFEGILRYSPVFYGYYSKTSATREGYRLPLAYFLTSLAVYAYSFIAILRKMAANSRMSKLAEDEECTFTWRLLAGWDFTIGNLEAAQNKVAAINTGFREALLEAKESEKEEKSWKLRARRGLAHLIVLGLIVASAYAVVLLVKRSKNADATSSWWRQNELTIILTLISMIYPNLFDLVGLLELRHPRNQLQWQLARIMALNLLNLYTFIFALFNRVDDMSGECEELKKNLTETYGQLTTMDFITMSTEAFHANVSESTWVSYTGTDYSILNDGFITLSDVVTTSLSDLNKDNSALDLLTTASLPSITTNTQPTLAQSEDQNFNLSSTPLATTLLAGVTYTGLPLVKTDPRLMASLQPGCYLVQAPCPSSLTTPTLLTTDMTATSAFVSATATTMASTTVSTVASPRTATAAGMLTSALTTVSDNDGFSMTDVAAENSSLVYEETTPVYDDDNVTIAEWVMTKSSNLGDNATLARPEEMSTLGVMSSGTYPGYEVTTLDSFYPRNDSEIERKNLALKLVSETFEENEASDLASLKPFLDKAETLTVASEMRRSVENSALLNLIEAMPDTPVRINPMFFGYLGIDDIVNWDDEDRRENEREITDNSAVDRITKREAVIPYALRFWKGQNAERIEQEIRSKGQEIQNTDQNILDRGYKAESNSQGDLSKEQDVQGKEQDVRGKGEEFHGSGQEDHGTDQEFLGRGYETQNNDQETRSMKENDQSWVQEIHNLTPEIQDKNQSIIGEGRVKRVANYNDYEAMSNSDLLDSPKYRSEIYNAIGNSTWKPPVREETSLNMTSGKEENSNGIFPELDEANNHNFVTPDVFDAFTTRDRKDLWDRLMANLNHEEKGSVTQIPSSQDGLTMQSSTGYATWMEVTREMEEDQRNTTEEPDIVADEDSKCYVVVCEETSAALPTSPTTSFTTFPHTASTSSTLTPTTLPPTTSTTTMPPSTLVASPTSNELLSTTDSSVLTSINIPSTPTPTEPPSFLVQPMKNNPEKWAPLLPSKMRQRLRKLCWETMFGQEIIKLTVMDMVVTVAMIVLGDFVRAVIVRLFNGCCCWDLEKQFPGYPDFKIAENILHLVNNQGMIWMGMFFSPGLPALNTLKLVVLLYVRSWAVVTSNVPPETVFKASNNNNFYLLFLLTMLFLCTLPVGYAVVWVEPSWHCGPFSDYPRIYQLATSTLIGGLPSSLYPMVDYISSPGVVIPAGLLLVLIIYYLLSLTAALREANSDLRDQLRRERSAEKRKALDARSGKGRPETPTTRWGRVVPLTPMPRPRLDATSDPEKPVTKKSPPVLSPEGESGPLIPLSDLTRGKDEGPWPDDVTDLGHSEVFDDSLSEPRKGGKDMPNKDVGMVRQEGKRHERERGKELGKNMESAPKSPYSRTKHRHNSYPQGARDEDEISLSRVQRGKHRVPGTQHKANRKHSDESISSSRVRPSHRQITDSPREKRRKGSGPQLSKLKKKMPEECAQGLNEILQQKESKHGKSPRAVDKVEPWKAVEPEMQTKVSPQTYNHREPSLWKVNGLHRNSQSKNVQQKNGTLPSRHCSSSEDSQSMQTIPVIKISKEDSVERSLQQAKLERQEKTLEDDPDTASDPYSVSTTETTSPSGKKYEDSLEMKIEEQDQHSDISQPKPAPTETDLDETYLLDCFDPAQVSDTTALLKKNKGKFDVGSKDEVEEPTVTLSSDEETLLDDVI
ncbi:transmembrane channel-like protein [Panulirus ornatus]|uniref:transmembrane channel-like protein n=1 Tax=Panulirus ornatus TaxID=150431 RepID=UPI003A868CB0